MNSIFSMNWGVLGMDLRRFITFKTIVEEGSFVRASRKLFCTQSTVTFHIQQLEQELSLQLFEKIGRRMTLTKEGKNVLPHVYELIRVMDCIRQAAQHDAEPNGELRVVVAETLLSYKMPAVLEKFKQRAPKVRLSLQSLNCYVIRDALLADDADLGIFYRVGHDNALAMENLGTQRLVLVASPKIENINFTQHNQQLPVSFIINEPQCIFRQIFETTIRQRNITFENTIELWSIESIKRCVSSNLGVSFLPYFTVEEELRTGELKELCFAETPLTITGLCAHHAGKVVSPAMKVFIECVRECLPLNQEK